MSYTKKNLNTEKSSNDVYEVLVLIVKNCWDPSDGIPAVCFKLELTTSVNKQLTVTEHIRQLALAVIALILNNAIKIYNDGSKIECQKF